MRYGMFASDSILFFPYGAAPAFAILGPSSNINHNQEPSPHPWPRNISEKPYKNTQHKKNLSGSLKSTQTQASRRRPLSNGSSFKSSRRRCPPEQARQQRSPGYGAAHRRQRYGQAAVTGREVLIPRRLHGHVKKNKKKTGKKRIQPRHGARFNVSTMACL